MFYFEEIGQTFIGKFACLVEINRFFKSSVGKMRLPAPLFSNHVQRIIFFCSKEKMGWIHAWRVIATMQNALILRYLSIVQSPGKSMSRMIDGFSVYFVSKENAIPEGVFFTFPDPARRSLFNVFKEPDFDWKSPRFVVAGLATFRSCLCSVTSFSVYFGSAVLAGFDILRSHGKLILSCAIPRKVNALAGFFYCMGGV